MLKYAREARAQNLSHAHLLMVKVEVQIVKDIKRVLNVTSDLAQGFRPNFGIR